MFWRSLKMLSAFAGIIFLAWLLSRREEDTGEITVADFDSDDPGEDVDEV